MDIGVDDVHAMINNYSMNPYERNAIHVHLYAYIAGNITREVKNEKMDHHPLSGMMLLDADGFEQNITIGGKQQGICGDVTGNDVTGDATLLSNYVGHSGYSLNCTG